MTTIDVSLDELELVCVPDEGRVVVRARGELDMASSVRLRRLLADLIRARTADIALDLSGVAFMDSSGLGAVLANLVAAEGVGLDFTITNPSKQVTRVMEMTGTYDRLVTAS